MCNTLYGMLQQRQRDLDFRTSQEDTLVRLPTPAECELAWVGNHMASRLWPEVTLFPLPASTPARRR
jgi:hypothetical protein